MLDLYVRFIMLDYVRFVKKKLIDELRNWFDAS